MIGSRNVAQTSRSKSIAAVVVIVVLALAFVGVLRAAADDDDANESSSGRVHVSVKLYPARVLDVGHEDSSLEFKSGRHKFRIEDRGKAKWRVHDVRQVEQLRSGTKIMLLGRRQERQHAQGVTVEPQIIAIKTVIVGSVEPPPITKKQREARLKWMHGTLTFDGKGVFALDGTNMQIGRNRPVLIVKDEPPDELKKGQILRIAGRMPVYGKKDKTPKLLPFVADCIEVIDRHFPASEYAILFPPQARPRTRR